MRFVICALVLSGCCLSSETKILARKIAKSTKNQQTEITALFTVETTDEEFQKAATKILARAKKLTETTAGLADILGAPKEVE